jgi:hypothetical protein
VRRNGKATTSNTIQGKIIGYGGSIKKNIYLNDMTGNIGRTTHVIFDEAQLSTPNGGAVSQLFGSLRCIPCIPDTDAPDTEEVSMPPEKLCIYPIKSYFLQVTVVCIPIKAPLTTFGLRSKQTPCPTVTCVRVFTSIRPLRSWNGTTSDGFTLSFRLTRHPYLLSRRHGRRSARWTLQCKLWSH